MTPEEKYEQDLAAWKTRMGITPAMLPGTTEHSEMQEIVMKAADRKLTGEDYCIHCGNGPQPISGMVLITRMDDPYVQPQADDDEDDEDALPAVENRVRACPKCFAIEYQDAEDDRDETQPTTP